MPSPRAVLLTALLAAEDLTIQGGRGGNEEELSLTPLRSAAANSLIGLLENGTLPVQWAASTHVTALSS